MKRRTMNPFKAFMNFLQGTTGSFRFDALPREYSFDELLRYETVADGNRNLREDLRRIGGDMRKAMNSISNYGSEESRAE